MTTQRSARLHFLTVLLVCAAGATSVSAQAWVPPGKVGAVNLIFQDVQHTSHILHDGSKLDGYDSESQGVLIEADYAITDRLSVTIGVPYIGSRYNGPEPSFFGLEIDDCNCWNRGWQDFGGTVRYNWLNGATAVTPFVGIGFPTNSYQYVGEATVGRRLTEGRIGVDAGRRMDGISNDLFVSGRYSYAFTEEVLGIDTDRSNLSASIGYLFTPALSGSVELYWQWTHGGLNSTEFVTDELFMQFDRLLKDNFFHAGATLSYSFTSLDVFASYIDFIDGKDTHDGYAVTIGISYPFELR